MMERRDLLPIIEAQISQWDCGISERAREFFSEVIRHAEITKKPLEIESFAMPCQDLADMALECLVKSTDYSSDDFESISDCIHMKIIAAHTPSKQYVESLLEVRASALFAIQYIEDGETHAHLAIQEVRELMTRILTIEDVIESRHWLEKSLHSMVEIEHQARANTKQMHKQTMQNARAERPSRHDWEKVSALESKLLSSGKPERSLAGIIEQRLKVPQSTYREWRKRKTTA